MEHDELRYKEREIIKHASSGSYMRNVIILADVGLVLYICAVVADSAYYINCELECVVDQCMNMFAHKISMFELIGFV